MSGMFLPGFYFGIEKKRTQKTDWSSEVKKKRKEYFGIEMSSAVLGSPFYHELLLWSSTNMTFVDSSIEMLFLVFLCVLLCPRMQDDSSCLYR